MADGLKAISRRGRNRGGNLNPTDRYDAGLALRDNLEQYCDDSLAELAICLLTAEELGGSESKRGALINFILAHRLTISEVDKIFERGAAACWLTAASAE
jgi:hypothetical protein